MGMERKCFDIECLFEISKKDGVQKNEDKDYTHLRFSGNDFLLDFLGSRMSKGSYGNHKQ